MSLAAILLGLSVTVPEPTPPDGSAPVRLDGQEIVAAAQQALTESLEERGQEIELSPLGIPAALVASPGPFSYFAGPASGRTGGPRVAIPVEIRGPDGRSLRTVSVWFAVSRLDDVLVAAADMHAGDTLGAERVMRSREDVAPLAARPLDDLEQIEGQRLRRSVRAGEILTRAIVEPVPMVRREQSVQVRLERAGITILARGSARGDGWHGDLVEVTVDGAAEPVSARVIDRGVVEVAD